MPEREDATRAGASADAPGADPAGTDKDGPIPDEATSGKVSPDAFAAGMRNRRRVLGDAYVDRSWAAAQATPFLLPLQEAVTGLAWGSIWDRPGLDLKTRSLVTVSVLIATNRRHELALHLRGALNVGWTREELQEIFLHAGCYCGWPAAVDAYRVAAEVFAELEAAGQAPGEAAR